MEERRRREPRLKKLEKEVTHLHECVEEVKKMGNRNAALIEENTKITQEVRDILTTFKVVGQIAKWATAVGAFFLGCYHAWQKVTGR